MFGPYDKVYETNFRRIYQKIYIWTINNSRYNKYLAEFWFWNKIHYVSIIWVFFSYEGGPHKCEVHTHMRGGFMLWKYNILPRLCGPIHIRPHFDWRRRQHVTLFIITKWKKRKKEKKEIEIKPFWKRTRCHRNPM